MDTLINKEILDTGGLFASAPAKPRLGRFATSTVPVLLMVFSDFIAFLLAFSFQFWLRYSSGFFGTYELNAFDPFQFGIGFLMYSLYWFFLFFMAGMYKNWYEWSPFDEIWNILKISVFGWLIAYFSIMFDSQNTPRLLVLVGSSSFVFLVIVLRFIVRRVQLSLKRNRLLRFNSLIFGCSDKALKLISKINASPSWGYQPVGFVNYERGESSTSIKSHLEAEIDRVRPDTLILTTDIHDQELLFDLASFAAERNMRVKIEPDLYHIFTGQTKAHNIHGIPLIEISPQLLKPWQEFAKRLFDIVFSLIVILVGLPIWLLVALMVKLDTPGPVFYSQMRVGKNNREFRIYKFRSMRQSNEKEQKWTLVGDKRVTRFGKFIRKTHLDEVPQFWNVLIGDMSIVGPRPEQPKFVTEFSEQIPYYNRRHVVRPGITGWWQINYGPYVISIDEIKNRTKDDFFYIENMSLKLDIEIVTRTVWCVIKGHGQA